MPSEWSLGLDRGISLMSGSIDQKQRAQQLKAQEADRQIRERRLNAEIEQIGIANRQLQTGIAEKARHDAEWINILSDAKAASVFADNPLEAEVEVLDQLAQSAAGNNIHAQQHLKSRAEFENKQALAAFNRQRPELEQARIEAATTRATDRIQADFEKQRKAQQHDFDILEQKHNDAMEKLDLQQKHDVLLEEMREKARATLAEGQVSREQWLNRHLNTTVKDIASTRAGAKLKPEERNAIAIKLLSDSWDAEIGQRRAKEAEAPGPAAVSGDLPVIPSKADFDKLPKGAWFKGKDGKTYKKP